MTARAARSHAGGPDGGPHARLDGGPAAVRSPVGGRRPRRTAALDPGDGRPGPVHPGPAVGRVDRARPGQPRRPDGGAVADIGARRPRPTPRSTSHCSSRPGSRSPSPFRSTAATGSRSSSWPRSIPPSPRPRPGGPLPRPGQVVVSPALAELLNGPDGEGFRSRLGSDDIVGTIAVDGLAAPGELRLYRGVAADPAAWRPYRVCRRVGRRLRRVLRRHLWRLRNRLVTVFLTAGGPS